MSHLSRAPKGRGEAEPVIQFAVDLLGDPRMNELTEERWPQLDEALPDIPNRDNILRKFSKTLFQRSANSNAPISGPTASSSISTRGRLMFATDALL